MDLPPGEYDKQVNKAIANKKGYHKEWQYDEEAEADQSVEWVYDFRSEPGYKKYVEDQARKRKAKQDRQRK